jgi:hypothetical protein
MTNSKKRPLTGMERLINVKESQLKALKGQHERLTESYKLEAGKLEVKIADVTAIINALKKN